jgi:Lon protease-like protein
MLLPNAVLFPQAFLPLHIFEPRYRRMLDDVLHGSRVFAVAMRKPARQREIPCPVAGLGLVRAAVERPDGTSHLILQGIGRVELGPTLRYRPYRVHAIRSLRSRMDDSVALDALTARVLELASRRLQPSSFLPLPGSPEAANAAEAKPGAEILAKVSSPDQIADLISWTLLPDPRHRQILLETLDVETRLRRLIRFLNAEPSPTTDD